MDNLFLALESCGEHFTDSSFTVVDMQKDHQPLVYINSHFLNLTGYSRDEVMNKNCRFLQGKITQPKVREALKTSLVKGVASYHDLINFKKNGEPFWNRLCLFPVHHEVIGLKYFVGIQLDVTAHKGAVTEDQLRAFSDIHGLSDSIHQEIENPLATLMSNSSALKYFSESDSESVVQREKILKNLAANVRQITQYVASLS